MRNGTGSISTPTPRAPKSFAAAITMRPSPQPRSYTTSPGPVPASLSIPRTASSVLGKYGTSGSKTGATPSVSFVSPNRSSAAQPDTRSARTRTMNRGHTTVSLWLPRHGNRGLSPVSEEHDHRAHCENAEPDERVGAVIGEARIEQIRAGEHENSGHHRIAGHAERPRSIALLHPENEEGDTRQHEKPPENRKRILHQALEARVLESAEDDQRERDRPLHEHRGARRTTRLVPAAEETEQRPVAAERVVGARADDHRAVHRSERGDRDHHRDYFLPGLPPDALHEVRRDRVRARHALVAEPLQVGEVHEQVEQGHDAYGEQQRAHHVAPAVAHLCGYVGGVVPASD